MGFLARLILILVLALGALAAVAWYLLSDTERLKPALEAELKARTGLDVEFAGPISWRLTPGVALMLEDVRIQDASAQPHNRSGQLERATIELSAPAVWSDVARWELGAIRLAGLELQDGDAPPAFLDSVILEDIQGQSALITTRGRLPGATPSDALTTFQIVGRAQADDTAQGRRLRFENADLRYEATRLSAAGRCELHLTRLDTPAFDPPPARAEDLLPLAELSRHELISDCAFSELTYAEETFSDVTAKVTLVDGSLNLHLDAKDIFRGSAIVEVDVNLKTRPIRWSVYPELDGVDSRAMLEWRGATSGWQGAFVAHSETRFTGNTPANAYPTINGMHEFESMAGTIDITRLKAQLMEAATLLGETDRVAAWPDTWRYQRFTGQLQTVGLQQTGEIEIDNVRIEIDGTIDYAQSRADLLTHVTVGPPEDSSPIEVGSLLENTRLPMRCRGPLDDLACKLDADAAQALVTRALRGDDDSGLRKKLEEKIEEEVPEEYRDAARSLLDLLGRALEGSN